MSQHTRPTDWQKWVIAGAISLGMACFLLVVMGGWRYDDPYITYRYAQNIGAGAGFIYNPAERTLSTTTPLFALVLAALQNPWQDLPGTANVIGAVCLALGGLAFWVMGRAWKTEAAGWAGLVLFPTFPLVIVTLGSETPLVLALCLWAFALAARGRYALAGLCAGLAFVARADAGIVAPLVGVMALLAPGAVKSLRGLVVAWLIPVLVWMIFAAAYFGSPLPATLAVKQAQGCMDISQQFVQGFATVQNWYLGGWHISLEVVLAGIGVAMFAVSIIRRQTAATGLTPVLIFIWSALYFAAYTALGVSAYFWYYAPLVPGFVAALGMGFEAVFCAMRRLRPRLAALVCAGLVGVMCFMQARSAIGIATFAADKRPPIYRAAGEWLNANTPPGASVGALEVGIIGYYAHRPMIDFAGLIQPGLAQSIQPKTTYDDLAVLAVRKFHPQFVVLLDGSLPGLKTELEQTNCEAVARFNGAEYDFGQNISILKCN